MKGKNFILYRKSTNFHSILFIVLLVNSNQIIPFYFDGEPVQWVLMEFLHRFIALCVSGIIVGLVLFAFIHRNQDKQGIARFYLTLLISTLLFVQILLGGLTIFSALDELIVTTHLAIAVTIFGLTIVHYNWVSKFESHYFNMSGG